MQTLIKETYETIYGLVSGNEAYELSLIPKNFKILRNFSKKIEEKYKGSIDKLFIQNFILFQFLYYEDKKHRLGKGRVYLNWILGDKALERWENKNEHWYYFVEQYRNSIGLPFPVEEEIEDLEKTLFYRSNERKRFYGSERGFLHCKELELYNLYSTECIKCKFKNNCIKNGNGFGNTL